jgi:hypothetical protein
MHDRSKAVTRNPASSPTPAVDYSPGPIREAHDAEHTEVARFTARHPEYSALAPDVIAQAMSTFRTDEEAAERAKLHGEGVPPSWRRGGGNEAGNTEETYDSLGRF